MFSVYQEISACPFCPQKTEFLLFSSSVSKESCMSLCLVRTVLQMLLLAAFLDTKPVSALSGSNRCFSLAQELVSYLAPRDLHRRAAY